MNTEQPLALKPPQALTPGEPVAKAWDEGYRAGINDERMSEANIGIAGFDAKVEPARNNPYRTPLYTAPQPQPDDTALLKEALAVSRQKDRTIRALELRIEELKERLNDPNTPTT